MSHEIDPNRVGQRNRWFGMDTCECTCGCGFAALGSFFGDDRDHRLCIHCAANEADWNAKRHGFIAAAIHQQDTDRAAR